jgi:hypothetical protein
MDTQNGHGTGKLLAGIIALAAVTVIGFALLAGGSWLLSNPVFWAVTGGLVVGGIVLAFVLG